MTNIPVHSYQERENICLLKMMSFHTVDPLPWGSADWAYQNAHDKMHCIRTSLLMGGAGHA